MKSMQETINMSDDEILRGFESGTFPHANWNHAAHLRVAGATCWRILAKRRYVACVTACESTTRASGLRTRRTAAIMRLLPASGSLSPAHFWQVCPTVFHELRRSRLWWTNSPRGEICFVSTTASTW